MKARTVVVLALAAASAACAASLTVNPVFQQISGQGVVTMEAGALGPSRLGGYDVLVRWDPAIIALSAVDFLAPGEFDGLSQWELLDLGLASIRAVFLGEAGDLIATQPEGFALAALRFRAVSQGISRVELEIVELTDAWAEPFGGEVSNGAVEVIPEPGSLWLLLAGGLGVLSRAGGGGGRRRARRRGQGPPYSR